jgi:hypothetical protein
MTAHGARSRRSRKREDDFKKELDDLKRLETEADATGIGFVRKEAEIKRGLLMSHEGMTRELMALALRKDEAFQRKVAELFDKKDVEEIHRLWIQYCEGK